MSGKRTGTRVWVFFGKPHSLTDPPGCGRREPRGRREWKSRPRPRRFKPLRIGYHLAIVSPIDQPISIDQPTLNPAG